MKKFSIIISLVIVLWMTFVWGHNSGFQEGTRIGDLKVQSINALNALGSYDGYASTAKDIEAGNVAKALCTVQVSASARVFQIKQCLESSSCKAIVESKVQEIAPELLSGGTPKLKIFKIGEKCVP